MSSIQSVGIDVSKGDLSVALLADDQSSTVRSFANSHRGVSALIKCLNKHRTAATVPCVIESTGDYHLRCALMIASTGQTVNVINPLITKQYQRASIRGAKDDTVDAVRLARIGQLEPNLTPFQATNEAIAHKKLVASIAKLETAKQRLTAHLKQLKEAAALLSVPVDTLALTESLAAIDRQIMVFEKTIRGQALPMIVDLSVSVRGVSQTSIAKLLTLLDGHVFTDRDKLVAFCGLDVAARRSGLWHGREKLSKRGHPYLRKLLFQMAWGLKQHHPEYQAYYAQLRARGKHYFTCLIAVARKFLRYLFAVVYKPQLV